MSFIRITLLSLLAALTGCTTLDTLYPSREERDFGEPDRNFTFVDDREVIPLSAVIASNPQRFAAGVSSIFTSFRDREARSAIREIRRDRVIAPNALATNQRYTLPKIIGQQGEVLATNAEVFLSVFNMANNPQRSRLVFKINLPNQQGEVTCGTVFIRVTANSPGQGRPLRIPHDDFFCVETNAGGTRLVDLVGDFRGLTQANLEHWAHKDPAAWQAVEAARQGATKEDAMQTRLSQRDAIICDESGEFCGEHYAGPQLLHHAVRQGTENGCWKVWLLTMGRATKAENASGTSAVSRHYARFVTCNDVTERSLPQDPR